MRIGPRISKEICKQSITFILRISKRRSNIYKELCQQLVPAACVFVFEVTQVNTAPRSAVQNLPVKWLFSALLDAHSASPVSIAGMYFILFSCRDLAGCAFFQKRYIERQAFQAFAFTWPPVSQRGGKGGLLWPMWLWRVIDREGLSMRYFKHVLYFATPFFIVDVPRM